MKRGRAGVDSRVAFRSWKNSNSQKGFGDGNVKPFSGFSDNWMRRARCIAMGFRSCIERTKRDCVWKVAAGGGKEGLRTRIVREKGGREEKAVEVNFLPGWWEETNYFPSARSHDGFLRFRWRVGGMFSLDKGEGVGVWRARLIWLGGSCWFSFWEKERDRESWLVEWLYWKDNEMSCRND